MGRDGLKTASKADATAYENLKQSMLATPSPPAKTRYSVWTPVTLLLIDADCSW
jgi:hypothetical protein